MQHILGYHSSLLLILAFNRVKYGRDITLSDIDKPYHSQSKHINDRS